MILKKIFFYYLLIFLLSCGYKTSPFFVTEKQKDFFLKYKVFYRQDFLILQAEIDFNEEFLWENLKIFSMEEKLEYEEQIIKKRKIDNTIEVSLNLPIKEKFFKLIYQNQESKFSSKWLKAVETNLPPLPQISYFFFDTKEQKENLLTIVFENLDNYYAIFYTENSIFPLLETKKNLKKYLITNPQAQHLFLRYRNFYGNESNKIDISIKK